jgi:hypothetical protein
MYVILLALPVVQKQIVDFVNSCLCSQYVVLTISCYTGVKIDKTRIQKKGPVKGFDALNNKQKSAPFNSEQNDEDNNYNDDEDEEMQLIMDEIYQKQLVKKQAADANNAKKCIEASFGLSNSMRPSSRGSHVGTDRRKVIPLEGISSSS